MFILPFYEQSDLHVTLKWNAVSLAHQTLTGVSSQLQDLSEKLWDSKLCIQDLQAAGGWLFGLFASF